MLHPGYLDASTARAWWTLHVWLIPVFPLISVAVWVLLREERGPLAWLARIAAYGFATFYTGLDVLAGIGAGLVTDVQQGGSPAVGRLFEIGDRLGATGVLALLLSALLTGGLLIRRHGLRAAPGTLLLVGSCYPFLTEPHLPPEGRAGHARHRRRVRAARRGRPRRAPADRPEPVSPPAARR